MCSSKTITAFLMSGFLLFSGGSLISSGILSPAAVSAAEGDYELNDYVLFDEDTCSMTINDITIDNSTIFYTQKDKDIDAACDIKLNNVRFVTFDN